MGRQSAVRGSREGGVGAAATIGKHRQAPSPGLFHLALFAPTLAGEFGLRADVDPPAGQAGGQAGVLALAADGQCQLVVGNDDRRLARLVVDEYLPHPRRREGLGDKPGRLVVVGDDVDLLAPELRDDHANPRAPRADACADRIDAVGVGDNGDLGAIAGLTRDVGYLDQAVGNFGNFELEQGLDQFGIAATEDDRRSLRRVGDLLDDRLDALAVVVALAVDLLGTRKQSLYATADAELHKGVTGVGLLDDAVDELADPVLVLLEHDVALRLADALEDDLLGRLGGDPAEVVGGDVPLLDLVAVLGKLLLRDLRLLGLDELTGVRVEVCALVDGLDDQLRLETLGHDQFDDAVVTGLGVELDAGILDRAGLLHVRREKRILKRGDQPVRADPLLVGQGGHRLDDLGGHAGYSSIRFARLICS